MAGLGGGGLNNKCGQVTKTVEPSHLLILRCPVKCYLGETPVPTFITENRVL